MEYFTFVVKSTVTEITSLVFRAIRQAIGTNLMMIHIRLYSCAKIFRKECRCLRIFFRNSINLITSLQIYKRLTWRSICRETYSKSTNTFILHVEFHHECSNIPRELAKHIEILWLDFNGSVQPATLRTTNVTWEKSKKCWKNSTNTFWMNFLQISMYWKTSFWMQPFSDFRGLCPQHLPQIISLHMLKY